MSTTVTGAVGSPLRRIEAREKVTGTARYAYENSPEQVAYAVIVQSNIARGEVTEVDAARALALDEVRWVIWAGNAPRLADGATGELAVLQSPRVAYRGQIVALVVADTLESARRAAELVNINYRQESHDVVLRDDHPKLYRPEKVNPAFDTDSDRGDFEAAFGAAAATIDATYRTPAE